ncbi:MAG: hypothetical protein FWF54_01080, partial [Candidatus Azobacteroides sp.]|nr:hypothetical protein [Candidatus Azobacteroides sp.]
GFPSRQGQNVGGNIKKTRCFVPPGTTCDLFLFFPLYIAYLTARRLVPSTFFYRYPVPDGTFQQIVNREIVKS